MQQVLSKTFGGLSRPYYFRHFVFGLIFPVFIFWMLSHAKPSSGQHAFPFTLVIIAILNTVLYPYARFVYEGVIGFLMGSNVLFVNAFIALWWKLVTMALCWSLAIFIAPIGLGYLYFHHSRAR
ncbi:MULTISPECIES: hypothetical protein [Ralstonia]|uniref:Integron gene cassette protein n=2 Tax=Ralstonia holmesii TaxID=3058602 RepID=A0ABC8QCB7_9RALS|nr:hypothetical protein [Ralstonia sp. LMG 32967]CAJ0691007.1 hypothetical protein R11007_01472 [Ralstonia sp. LMG 32967]CAJ0791644.1 hypothetical protein LMG18096_02569 [Ralstonia sp. LMG 32967]CAJ0816597.1 hypothetical protein LMG18093_03072 [Ralstonia sp. LMG 32967]